MASSSAQRDPATRAPPPAEQLATFYKLVEKHVTAAMLCRHARDVELSAQAATHAEALFGEDSLVVASLRMSETRAVLSLALEASDAETKSLYRRVWVVLLSSINLLLRRLEANTLLPGNVWEEEIDFEARAQVAAKKAANQPARSLSALRILTPTMGYNILLDAMFKSLNILQHQMWPAAQKRMVESFVLQGLDVITLTAGVPASTILGETNLVVAIVEKMDPRDYDPAFYAAVLRKWRSAAVSSVLQSRGVLQTGVAKFEESHAEFEARKRADIAEHGLRDCALPSCSKTEKTVKEFSLCAGCRSQVYCCLEHQALDWKAHKKVCKEKQAARLAEEAGAGAA